MNARASDLHVAKFLLDSGDPNEYREIAKLARNNGSELWGATTNPTLIAKKLAGKKISQNEAFTLQKEIVLEIINIVPGAVSAEVYTDEATKAHEMIEQGRVIAGWHHRVVVKLPTTIEGFKARTVLRKENVPINNTLVFSQAQMYAICLHEKIIQEQYGPTNELWPCFISPFVGRLDDIGVDGMMLIQHGMKLKWGFNLSLPHTKLAIWMLEASVRRVEHIKRGLDLKTELITVPAKVYKEWFALSENDQENLDPASYAKDLKPIEVWESANELNAIDSLDEFIKALENGGLDISHPLTAKGLTRFADDWKAIIAQ